MNRSEFLTFIIKKKNFNKEIYKYSLVLEDFPIARQVLNKLDGNIHTNILLKSDNIVEIRSAQAALIANVVNFIKDSLLKSETKKFIDDLVDQKIIKSSFAKNQKNNNQSNNTKRSNLKNESKKVTKEKDLTPTQMYNLILKKEGFNKNQVSKVKSAILKEQIVIRSKSGETLVTYWKDYQTKQWEKMNFTKNEKDYLKDVRKFDTNKNLENILVSIVYVIVFCLCVIAIARKDMRFLYVGGLGVLPAVSLIKQTRINLNDKDYMEEEIRKGEKMVKFMEKVLPSTRKDPENNKK